MKAERREQERFETDIRIVLSTVNFITNVKTDAYITDCSRMGARVVSPVYFNPNTAIQIQVDVIGGSIQLKGQVLSCKEDVQQKERFEKTYMVHVQFSKITDWQWDRLLGLGKK